MDTMDTCVMGSDNLIIGFNDKSYKLFKLKFEHAKVVKTKKKKKEAAQVGKKTQL